MTTSKFKTADPGSFFSRMLSAEAPRPAVHALLGSTIESVDTDTGLLRIRYEARPDFGNPAGTVQGGMLAAMLDDLTASLVDATLVAGQGVATLSLQVSFLRAARIGTPISGEARMQRRGRDICHVTGLLRQNGTEIASAVSVCKIVAI